MNARLRKQINTYKEAHNEWAIQALKRDKYACRKCGLGFDSRQIIVHHLDESRRLGVNKMNNELKNLLSLCRTCHAEIHGYTEDVYKKRKQVAKMIVLDNMSYAEAGKKLGISRQRIYQILWRTSGKAGNWEEIRKLASEQNAIGS